MAGKTRRRGDVDELADLIAIKKQIKTLTRDLQVMINASNTR